MWHGIFSLHPSIAEKVVRAVLVYAFLVLALRLGGKRELSQISTIDFVVLLAVANAVQNGIIGDDNSVTGAVVGATTLFLLNGVLIVLVLRSPRARKVLVGTPALLVVNGRFLDENLRRERLSRDDVLQAVTEAGAGGIDEVEECSIEPNGRIVVNLRENDPNSVRFDAILGRLSDIEKRLDGGGTAL